ncbi:MAG: type I glutamate--ammonia ligase [bacterium]
MSVADTLKLIKEHEAKFVDFRFTDTRGKEQHVTVPTDAVDESTFARGKMFDGSSITGWKGIDKSDMILMPDPNSAQIDPFYQETTVNLRCSVIEPEDMQGYDRDPRSTAERAEEYLRDSGIADTAYFGPENEFFLFDSVVWGNEMGNAFYEIDSTEAAWNSGKDYDDGNTGHRPTVKGGYFPVPPVDSQSDVRSAICSILAEMGLQVEVHHHEVGTAGQGEIGIGFNSLVKKADEVQLLKYVIHNVAHNHGMTATFMPKPLVGDNGSGMHVHMSMFKGGKNLFNGEGYGELSETALHYIGGIFKHARAINAFSNASTNSYKRLVPGFEAPVLLAYSARNRSAACRIPYEANPKGRRIEIRFPDSTANPYLAFSALLMAGIDGIKNKIHPGEPDDRDLYDLSPEEEKKIPTVSHSLANALMTLNNDREFLTVGGVFTDDAIDAYIEMKMVDVNRLQMETHPCEFEMYYSL